MQTPIEAGPAVLRPLIGALTEFFKQAGMMYENQIPVMDSRAVRRELFKLSYMQDKFGLNMKADAFESYDFLLTSMHSWASYVRMTGA